VYEEPVPAGPYRVAVCRSLGDDSDSGTLVVWVETVAGAELEVDLAVTGNWPLMKQNIEDEPVGFARYEGTIYESARVTVPAGAGATLTLHTRSTL